MIKAAGRIPYIWCMQCAVKYSTYFEKKQSGNKTEIMDVNKILEKNKRDEFNKKIATFAAEKFNLFNCNDKYKEPK